MTAVRDDAPGPVETPRPRWWRTRRGWVTFTVAGVGTYAFAQLSDWLGLFG